MKIKTLLTAALCSLTLIAGGAVAKPGQGPGAGPGMNPPAECPLIEQLDLTEAQQAQFNSLKEKHHSEMKALKEESALRKQHHQEMAALLSAKSFDETAAMKMIAKHRAEREALADQMKLLKLKHKFEMMQLLNEEQKQKFLLLDAMRPGKAGKGGQHGMRGPGPQGPGPMAAMQGRPGPDEGPEMN